MMRLSALYPKINDTSYNFSSRDCLGIESVAASISAELCPIVNTVTPRAFYWPFMAWIYYDFYINSGITEYKITTFDRHFLKRQDYFFVLSSIIDEQPDQYNLVGKQITGKDYLDNPSGPYTFNPKYFQTTYGGMQYYNAGCLTMRFITREDEKNNRLFELPRLTQIGKEMALAFEKVIKNTAYYRNYRLQNIPVPKEVLEEYGHVINIGLKGFDECKKLMRHHLFELNNSESRRLKKCSEYLKLICREFGKREFDLREIRSVLFDYYSSRGLNHSYPEELRDTVSGWEIVIGRQYFTTGIEMIWKYMLNILSEPMSLEKWTDRVISGSSAKDYSDTLVRDLLPECVYDHGTREKMITDARRSKDSPDMVENGLRIALSIYNWFTDREDLGETSVFLDYGRGRYPGTGSISVSEWIDIVNRYRKKTVREFLEYVIEFCIVDQHKRTCYDKITRAGQSINGYYFDCVDDLYIRNEHVFQIDFQGVRLIQLMRVMNDLDMFDEETA